MAFKGRVKLVRPSTFSVACVTTDAPAGASCRMRVIVGNGQVLGTATTLLGGSDARLRVTLSGTPLRAARRAPSVRFAVDLLGATGRPLATERTTLPHPFRR